MITRMQKVASACYVLAMLLAVLVPIDTAQSQDAEVCKPDDSIGYRARLVKFGIGDCYLIDPEYQKLERVVSRQLIDAKNQEERTAATLAATTALIQAGGLRTESLQPTVATLNAELTALVQAAFDELNQWQPKSDVKRNGQHWGQQYWVSNAGEPWGLVQDAVDKAGCSNVIRDRINEDDISAEDRAKIEECGQVYEQTLTASGLLFSMRNIDSYYFEQARTDRIRDHELNVARWDSYLSDMQFQYPWELMLSYCADNPRSETSGEFARWKCFVPILGSVAVREHIQSRPDQGFVRPPMKRWIFLHPDIGLLYSEDQPSGSKLAPALTFQWLGRFWYKFDGNSGEIVDPFGVSIVSTVADLPNSRNHGLGLMGHYRNFSLAVTKHDDDVMVTLNLNLAGLLFKDSSLVKDFIGTPNGGGN